MGQEALIAPYIDALCIDLSHNLSQNNAPLSSIFIGGGTPNALDSKFFAKIFDTIAKCATLKSACEISIESNVNLLNFAWCKDLLHFGANRLSVGVQSFETKKLKLLEREHCAKDIAQRIDLAYSAGFSNINIDLIFNTSLDSKALIDMEVAATSKLPLSHISAYELSIDSGSRFANAESSQTYNNDKRKGEDTALCFYMREALEYQGFKQYEVSNYARDNAQCKHNLGYWQGKDYIGCGLSAVGCVDSTRFKALDNLEQYIQDPLHREIEHLSDNNVLIERIMLGLRSTCGVNMSIFKHTNFLAPLLNDKCHITKRDNSAYLVANELFLADEITLWISARI